MADENKSASTGLATISCEDWPNEKADNYGKCSVGLCGEVGGFVSGGEQWPAVSNDKTGNGTMYRRCESEVDGMRAPRPRRGERACAVQDVLVRYEGRRIGDPERLLNHRQGNRREWVTSGHCAAAGVVVGAGGDLAAAVFVSGDGVVVVAVEAAVVDVEALSGTGASLICSHVSSRY
jgi:hypothetical protein